MRGRSRRKTTPPAQNLDSFLDVMTNTVGCLMFISLFVSLFVSKGNLVVQTPLASETKKIPRFFEINDNRITYLDDEKVGVEIEKLIGNLPACNPPNYSDNFDIAGSEDYVRRRGDYESCVRNRGLRLTNFSTQTEFYNIKMVNPATFSMVYEPIPTKKGENKVELALKNSSFQATLAKLNPSKDYVAFIVRPDSFSAFRVARKQAATKGFQTGWEPLKKEQAIVFGSGGREIGVQ
jgi:hypothetical protein